ncbi:MAG: hypothetical protein ACPK85_07995 [Methanosarcina sp.]
MLSDILSYDTLNSIKSFLYAFINLIILLIIFYIIGYVFKKVLEFLLEKADDTFDFASEIVATSLKWISEVIFVLGVLFLTFVIVIYAFWLFIPNSLYIDLNANNHNAEIDLSNIAIEGTYVETNTGYLVKPNLPFPLPVVPRLPITKIDSTHVSLLRLKFIMKSPKEIKGHPVEINERLLVLNPNGVYSFVPDRG